MTYSRPGGWTIDGELRITASIAHALETLVDCYLKRYSGNNEQDDEALKTVIAVVADRLEDMAADAERYIETDSVDYRELVRLADIGREVELDRKFRQVEADATGAKGTLDAEIPYKVKPPRARAG